MEGSWIECGDEKNLRSHLLLFLFLLLPLSERRLMDDCRIHCGQKWSTKTLDPFFVSNCFNVDVQ